MEVRIRISLNGLVKHVMFVLYKPHLLQGGVIDEIREVLSLQKQSLCEIYQITEIGIFGSYARGEETEASDIDILVDCQ